MHVSASHLLSAERGGRVPRATRRDFEDEERPEQMVIAESESFISLSSLSFFPQDFPFGGSSLDLARHLFLDLQQILLPILIPKNLWRISLQKQEDIEVPIADCRRRKRRKSRRS